jgi:hypothetical protein
MAAWLSYITLSIYFNQVYLNAYYVGKKHQLYLSWQDPVLNSNRTLPNGCYLRSTIIQHYFFNQLWKSRFLFLYITIWMFFANFVNGRYWVKAGPFKKKWTILIQIYLFLNLRTPLNFLETSHKIVPLNVQRVLNWIDFVFINHNIYAYKYTNKWALRVSLLTVKIMWHKIVLSVTTYVFIQLYRGFSTCYESHRSSAGE